MGTNSALVKYDEFGNLNPYYTGNRGNIADTIIAPPTPYMGTSDNHAKYASYATPTLSAMGGGQAPAGTNPSTGSMFGSVYDGISSAFSGMGDDISNFSMPSLDKKFWLGTQGKMGADGKTWESGENGMLNPLMTGLGVGANAYLGYKNYGLAKDQFNEQLHMNKENLGMAKDQLYGKDANGQYNKTTKHDQANAAYAAAPGATISAFAK